MSDVSEKLDEISRLANQMFWWGIVLGVSALIFGLSVGLVLGRWLGA